MFLLCLHLLIVQRVQGYAPMSGGAVDKRYERIAGTRSLQPEALFQASLPRLKRIGTNRHSKTRLHYIVYDEEEEGSGGKPEKEVDEEDAIEQKAIEIVNALGSNPCASSQTPIVSSGTYPRGPCPSIHRGYSCGIVALSSSAGTNFRTTCRHIAMWGRNGLPIRYVCLWATRKHIAAGELGPFRLPMCRQEDAHEIPRVGAEAWEIGHARVFGIPSPRNITPFARRHRGMAITHMAQLQHLSDRSSIFTNNLVPSLGGISESITSVVGGVIPGMVVTNMPGRLNTL